MDDAADIVFLRDRFGEPLLACQGCGGAQEGQALARSPQGLIEPREARKPRDPAVAKRNEKIVSLFLQGVPSGKIATKLGVNRDIVYSHIAAMRTAGKIPRPKVGRGRPAKKTSTAKKKATVKKKTAKKKTLKKKTTKKKTAKKKTTRKKQQKR